MQKLMSPVTTIEHGPIAVTAGWFVFVNATSTDGVVPSSSPENQ
jgi:hypothetical protein